MNTAISKPSWSAPATRRKRLISLTPLIDVVFILLIFFMLSASFVDWRVIDLAAPAHAGAGPSSEGSLLVEVGHDNLRLSGTLITLDALVIAVTNRLLTKPDQRVLLKPSAEVPLQRTIAVVDRLAAAGATDVAFIDSLGR